MSVVQPPNPLRWRIATDDPILPGAPLVAREAEGGWKAVLAEPGQKPCWVATSHPSRGSVEVTIYDGCAKYDPRPLVERVEQAIKLALHRHGETEYVGEAPRYRNFTQLSGDFDLREVARAAIQAMHIPTKNMVREASRFGGTEDRIEAEATWETMIEAGLAEPTAPR